MNGSAIHPMHDGGLRRGISSAREAASILGEKELEELDPRACLGLL